MPNIRNLANTNVGTAPNSGDGDILREAFIKVNNNINAIYNNGQYKAFIPDSEDFPGYTWDGDNDTGFYRPGTGQIGVTLNGTPHLLMNESGSIQWLDNELSTQDYVNQQFEFYSRLIVWYNENESIVYKSNLDPERFLIHPNNFKLEKIKINETLCEIDSATEEIIRLEKRIDDLNKIKNQKPGLDNRLKEVNEHLDMIVK